jgi:hypothetical protein
VAQVGDSMPHSVQALPTMSKRLRCRMESKLLPPLMPNVSSKNIPCKQFHHLA